MKKLFQMAVIGFICVIFSGSSLLGEKSTPAGLLVIWSSGDRDVAMNMVFMYTHNAKKNGWWETVRLLIWGASAKLLTEDSELKQEIQKMKDAGVELLACKACADRYGVSGALQGLGITVKYMGVGLTEMLKSGWTTLTF